MARMPYWASGDPPANQVWKFLFPKTMKFIDSGTVPEKLPPWLTDADLDFFAGEFKRSGFRGGNNRDQNVGMNLAREPVRLPPNVGPRPLYPARRRGGGSHKMTR